MRVSTSSNGSDGSDIQFEPALPLNGPSGFWDYSDGGCEPEYRCGSFRCVKGLLLITLLSEVPQKYFKLASIYIGLPSTIGGARDMVRLP